MNLKNKDILVPKSYVKSDCGEPTPGSTSLKCWLSSALKAENGLTFDPETLTYKLGGELAKETFIEIPEGGFFGIRGTNGVGLFQYDDDGNTVSIGDPVNGKAISINENYLNISHLEELTIVSNNMTIRHANNISQIEIRDQFLRITTIQLLIHNLPTYADEAAATAGGALQTQMYKTATGELRIKL